MLRNRLYLIDEYYVVDFKLKALNEAGTQFTLCSVTVSKNIEGTIDRRELPIYDEVCNATRSGVVNILHNTDLQLPELLYRDGMYYMRTRNNYYHSRPNWVDEVN